VIATGLSEVTVELAFTTTADATVVGPVSSVTVKL
jgi:hypothetical protein